MGEEWWKRRVHMFPEDAQAVQLSRPIMVQ